MSICCVSFLHHLNDVEISSHIKKNHLNDVEISRRGISSSYCKSIYALLQKLILFGVTFEV